MAKLQEGDVVQDDKGVFSRITTISWQGHVYTSPPSRIRSTVENLEMFIDSGTHKLFRRVR